MKSERAKTPLSRLRRSDKIILGIIAAMVVVTIVLNILQRFGLALVNTSLMLFIPILALVVLAGWGAFALIRRIRSRVARISAGIIAAMLLFAVVALGFTYLSFVAYTVMPHQYRVLSDSSGGHRMVVLWRFDTDAEHSQQTLEARKAARLEAYPDSSPETITDDVCVAFDAYPLASRWFYRSNADVEGKVYLAYTGNIVPKDTLGSAEPPAAEAPASDGAADAAPAESEPAEAEVIETPHGTMMLEWLDDGTTAHFYVQDPGVAEGGECTVRFGK